MSIDEKVHENQGFISRAWNRVKKAVSNTYITSKYRTILFLTIATLATNVAATPTTDAELDTLLKQSHSMEWYLQNPFPERGAITGVAGNANDEYALVWADGVVGRFHEGEQTPFAQFASGLNATAISYVTPGAGILGDIAVADIGGFNTYTLTGSDVSAYPVFSSAINDLKIDLGKVWIATIGNYGTRNSDGTLSQLGGGNISGVQPTDLISGFTDRFLLASGVNTFSSKLDSSANPIAGTAFNVDYYAEQGFGLTSNELLTVQDDYIIAYANPYQGIMVPEPATLALLGAGALLLAGRNKKEEKTESKL